MAKGFILCNDNARGTLFKFFFLCRYSLSIEGNKIKEKEGRSLVFFLGKNACHQHRKMYRQ